MKNPKWPLKAALLLVCTSVAAVAQPHAGTIVFSDSNVLSGEISLSPGSELKLQAGKEIHVLDLDRVQEIEFAPEKEEMDRAWRFKEAGQTAKEYFGEPYPVRYLAATVTLGGGEKITGHLYTTVLYVTDGDNARKVILLAKQRGKEGETLQSLVYPKQISFGDNAVAAEAQVQLKLAGLPPGTQVVGITRGALVRLQARSRGSKGEFEMPSPLGHEFFLAARSSAKIIAGWPTPSNDRLSTQVANALTNSEDFFDERRVLGAFEDAKNADIYSLVLAVRKGRTTLHETRSQPWRLEIYRWKRGDDGRVMLAGQNYFFRGIDAKDKSPPTVELSEELWKIRKVGDLWTTETQ